MIRKSADGRGVIGIVVQNTYPHDTEVRARKMARSLAQSGFRVVLLAENRNGDADREVLAPETTVRRFPSGRAPAWSRWLAKGHPWNLPWAAWIWRVAREEGFDLLISSNIGLGLQTGIAGRFLGIPVILDLFENNPGAVEARGKDRWFHHLTRNRTAVDLVERWSIRLADRTWVVAEENAERLIRRGIDPQRLSLVGNTPLPEDTHLPTGEAASGEGEQGPFRITYVGVIHEFRGLDLLLDILPHLTATNPDVELVIGGDGPYRKALERRAAALGVSDKVRFLGWVPADDVPRVISRSQVGVISNYPSDHTQNTIPNKLFDYMACGIPVVSTPLRPIERILEEWSCGLVIPPDDPEAAAAVFERLRADPDLRRKLGSNGKMAVGMRFNWWVEELTILREVRRLVSPASPPPPRRIPRGAPATAASKSRG